MPDSSITMIIAILSLLVDVLILQNIDKQKPFSLTSNYVRRLYLVNKKDILTKIYHFRLSKINYYASKFSHYRYIKVKGKFTLHSLQTTFSHLKFIIFKLTLNQIVSINIIKNSLRYII